MIIGKPILGIIPPFYQLKSGYILFLISMVIAIAICFGFHFVVQFTSLYKLNLPLTLIIFHYLGLFVGSAMYLRYFSIYNKQSFYYYFFSGLILSMIAVLLATNPLLIIISLFSAGFFVGTTFILVIQLFGNILQNPEHDGLFYYWAMPAVAIILIIIGIFSTMDSINIIIFLLVMLLIGALTYHFALQSVSISVPKRKRNNKLIYYFRRIENLPYFLFYVTIGFFFVNIYLAAPVILDFESYNEFVDFLIIILSSLIIFFLPIGIIFDKIGRRISMAIGIVFHALAYLTISFIPTFFADIYPDIITAELIQLVKTIIFPSLLALGFSIVIMGSVLYLIESEKTTKHIETAATSSGLLSVAIGSIFAVIIIELLAQELFKSFLKLAINDPLVIILPVVLFLVYVPALIIIYFSKETQVSYDEKFWWKSTKQLILLDHNYNVQYNQRLKGFNTTDSSFNSNQIINQLEQQLPLPKKIEYANDMYLIKRSENCVIIIYTSLELQILEKKMSYFLTDFEALGAVWDEDRLIEIIHKHFIKQEYILKFELDQHEMKSYLKKAIILKERQQIR